MNFKGLIAAASVVALLPISASALSLRVFDSSGQIASIDDNGAGDLSPIAGRLSAEAASIGGYTGVSGSISTVVGFPPLDDFSATFDIASGNGYLRFEVTHLFDNGLPTPTNGISGATTNLTGLGGTATSSIYLGNAAYDRGTLLSMASGSSGTDTDLVNIVSSPYWITSVFEIRGALNNSGTANAEFAAPAAVPVPAGILLMGTALAGLGVMHRRRKAA
jgi:hypothetical protein